MSFSFLWSRASAVVAGLLLVLVPTLFSLFPEWTKWGAGVRGTVLIGWFLAACLVVHATARQSKQVEDLVGQALERRDAAREAAITWLLHALLQPAGAHLPDQYEIRLFLPNDDGRLMPEYESPGSAPSEGWEPGRGATGTAWAIEGLVVARGAAVSDGTYGLTPAQQAKYKDLQIVTANPIQSARGQRLGVLAASSDDDDGFFDQPEALLDFVALCDVVARVLVDIGRIDHD